jgi:hypothetical protein
MNNNKLITKVAAVLMGMATIARVAFYEAEMVSRRRRQL